MRARTLLAAPLLLALSCGGNPLSAEVEVERFCFSQPLCTGTPATACLPPSPGTGSITLPALDVPIQTPPLLRTSGSEVNLWLLDARLTPPAGVNLSGLQRLQVEYVPAAGAPQPLATYVRPGPNTTPVAQVLLSGNGTDIAALLQSGKLRVQLAATVDGPNPAAAWSADLTLCLHGKTVISYF